MNRTRFWLQAGLCSVVCLSGAVGCNKPAAQAAKDDVSTQVAEQTIVKEEHMHEAGEHHHRFDKPEEYAKSWNSAERDSWQKPDEIIKAMNAEAGDVVADIGAGTGYMVAHLSKAVGESGEVMAIDVEESMVTYIAARKETLGPATITPRKVSSESPALKPASMDSVMTLNTWHHVGSRDAYAKKVFDGLKAGGTFVVVDFEMDADPGPPAKMRLAPEQVIKELEGAGFEVKQADETMPRHYMIVGTRPGY